MVVSADYPEWRLQSVSGIFAWPNLVCVGLNGDEKRSRGVLATTYMVYGLASGSSPLAFAPLPHPYSNRLPVTRSSGDVVYSDLSIPRHIAANAARLASPIESGRVQ